MFTRISTPGVPGLMLSKPLNEPAKEIQTYKQVPTVDMQYWAGRPAEHCVLACIRQESECEKARERERETASEQKQRTPFESLLVLSFANLRMLTIVPTTIMIRQMVDGSVHWHLRAGRLGPFWPSWVEQHTAITNKRRQGPWRSVVRCGAVRRGGVRRGR